METVYAQQFLFFFTRINPGEEQKYSVVTVHVSVESMALRLATYVKCMNERICLKKPRLAVYHCSTVVCALSAKYLTQISE